MVRQDIQDICSIAVRFVLKSEVEYNVEDVGA